LIGALFDEGRSAAMPARSCSELHAINVSRTRLYNLLFENGLTTAG
jgi:hypothetical protein